MSKLSPLPLLQKIDTDVLTEEQPEEISPSTTATDTTQLTLSTDQQAQQSAVSTEQLHNIFDSLLKPADALTGTTEQSKNISGPLPITSTPGRIVRIPGSLRKGAPTTEELPSPSRRMGPRLRHGLVLLAIVLVGITTLLSLTPLDNGQSAFPVFFKDVSNWLQTQEAHWQFQAHLEQAAQGQGNLQPTVTPPPMTIPKSVYVDMARQDAINAGISPDYFVRQINMESGFNPNAISPSGAVGIAQFLPGTAYGLHINPWDPKQALQAAANLMASYAKTYGGDYAKALAAYNGGTGTVQHAINACGAANWMNCLPGETRNYIRIIMGI